VKQGAERVAVMLWWCSFVAAPELGGCRAVPGGQPEPPRRCRRYRAGAVVRWLRFDIASPHPELISRSAHRPRPPAVL